MKFIEVFGRMSDLVSRRPIRVNKEGQIVTAPSTHSLVKKVSIDKGGTTSSIVDLGDHYRYMLVTLPALDTATLKLQVSLTHGGTYQDLSTTTTASGDGSYNTTFNLLGWRYVRIVASATQSSSRREFDVQGVTF